MKLLHRKKLNPVKQGLKGLKLVYKRVKNSPKNSLEELPNLPATHKPYPVRDTAIFSDTCH